MNRDVGLPLSKGATIIGLADDLDEVVLPKQMMKRTLK